MTILLALIAATLFALGSVLEQRVAMTKPDSTAHSPWFLFRLLRHPVWLAGFACSIAGFFFHAGALAGGELVVVQPILAMTMVLALPLGAWLSDQRITRRDVAASLLLTVALAVFLILSNPAPGTEDPSNEAWLASGGIAVVVAAALTVFGLRGRPAAKAALVGLAAGVLFGLHAALTKGSVEQFDSGFLGPFENWQLYAVIVLGLVAMTVTQISLQAGDLPPAISTQAIGPPLVGVALGVTLFDETLHETATGAVLSLLALMAIAVGIVALAEERGSLPDAGSG